MRQTDRLYAFDGWCKAQDYEVGVELPIVIFDKISGRNVRYLYKVVNDGEFVNDLGKVIGCRKLWELVNDN